MSNVTITLPTIISALFPPEDVTTVADYQAYLQGIFGAKEAPQRKLKKVAAQHPHWSADELTQLFAKVRELAEASPEVWQNDRGRPVRLLHQDQPDDPSLIRLDNDVFAQFVLMPEVENGTVSFPMEPVPYVAE